MLLFPDLTVVSLTFYNKTKTKYLILKSYYV